MPPGESVLVATTGVEILSICEEQAVTPKAKARIGKCGAANFMSERE
jgi:hypothetical protein